MSSSLKTYVHAVEIDQHASAPEPLEQLDYLDQSMVGRARSSKVHVPRDNLTEAVTQIVKTQTQMLAAMNLLTERLNLLTQSAKPTGRRSP